MSICTNCNGKGYNTLYKGEGGYTDFGPMEYIETAPMGIHKVPCSKCQLKEEVEEFENETIGQTIHEQLEEMLHKCIELGWRKGAMHKAFMSCDITGVHFISRDEFVEKSEHMSYHDLFSKESDIMEFVEWRWADEENDIDNRIEFAQDKDIEGIYDAIYDYSLLEYKYMMMGKMTGLEKIQYFINNAIIPKE